MSPISRKPKAAAPAAKSPAPPPTVSPAPAVPSAAVGTEAAFERYLPLAKALADSALVPYRLDPILALHNVQVAIAALTPHRDLLRRALPLLDVSALFDVPALAQAVVFAATQVAGKGRSLGETQKLLTEASQLRALLLGTAEMLALSGIFKAAAVDKIRAGRGAIDLASDCVELAALYGKSPDSMKVQRLVQRAQLTRASELGTELLTRLRPGAARTGEPVRAGAPATTDRDRLASLLAQRYKDVRRAGYYLWLDACDDHVPSLQARKLPRSKKKPPAPEVPPTP